MRARLRASLTYANVMATVAVFIALGGGAYAVTLGKNSVKAKQIAPNAVGASEIGTGAVGSGEVRNNAITGIDVNESRLGKVPNASNADRAGSAGAADTAARAAIASTADSASTAGNASTVGGLTVRRFNVGQPAGAPAQPILELGGLKLSMSCGTPADVTATTTKDDSSIYVWGIYTGINTVDSEDLEGGDFELNESFDVDDNMGGGGFDPDLGTLLYEARDGTVVTVDLVLDFNGPTPNHLCHATGTAIGG